MSKLSIIVSYPDIKGFWEHIGPVIANRKYIQEIGENIYQEEGKVWFLGFDIKTELFIGFCALSVDRKTAHLRHDFILPEFRGKGFYSELYQNRLNWIKEKHSKLTIKTVIYDDKSIHLAIKNSLTLSSQKGRYLVYTRGVNENI